MLPHVRILKQLVNGRPVTNPELPAVRVVRHDMRARVLTVLRTEDITPHLRRVVLGGPGLEPDFPHENLAVAEHVKLFFPRDGATDVDFPANGIDGLREMAPADRPANRTYTVRAYDAEKAEVSIDFVLHGEGIASVWAAHAEPGHTIAVAGPRGSKVFPHEYAHYVVVADTSAFPAAARWIEELPATCPVTVFALVDDFSDLNYLPQRELVAVLPLQVTGRGDDGDNLLALYKQQNLPPVGESFVFAAGETLTLRPLRRYLMTELDVPRAAVEFDGYWKRGVTNLDHHLQDPLDPK